MRGSWFEDLTDQKINRLTFIRYDRIRGRGISVDPRWLDIKNFIEDMGERPQGTTLDRINPNGNYEKSNCRWATSLEQGQTKRNNHLLTHNGRTQSLAAWSRELKIPENTIRNRVNNGQNFWEAQR